MATDDSPDRVDVGRRSYLHGVAAAGGTIALGGLAASTAGAQQDTAGTVTAVNCGPAAIPQPGGFPGQVQQCIACVEERCDEEVGFLEPLYTGLTGQCFEPPEIPQGANFVTLKAGRLCFVAPVSQETEEICLPQPDPEISNATFYQCGADPPENPEITRYFVDCDFIEVGTANVPPGSTLTATVTFLTPENGETTETFQATVQADGTATFDLSPGQLDPAWLTITFENTVLLDVGVRAENTPCHDVPPEPPEPPHPRLESLRVTCDFVTLTTTDVPAGDSIAYTVRYVTDVVETGSVEVEADGTAVIPLDGELDPTYLVLEYGGDVLYDANVQAEDAPCMELPPEPPKKGKRKRKRDGTRTAKDDTKYHGRKRDSCKPCTGGRREQPDWLRELTELYRRYLDP